MPVISRTFRCWLALVIWALGLMLLFGLGWWNLHDSRRDAENRLIGEAGRVASQLARLLSMPEALDEISARTIVMGAMEDDRVYAIKIETEQGILEGQKRNYLWEPVPWDDEIAENCVQGMSALRAAGGNAGKVEVWLSPRASEEENSLLVQRERLRFLAVAFFGTAVLVLLFWQWGDLRRLRGYMNNRESVKQPEDREKADEKISLGLSRDDAGKKNGSDADATLPVNASLGRKYQRRHPDSWLVTAGMFRQTFARGPALISRLYAEGETAGLCHLGRMLEQAAPCVGAEKLACAAREMQNALNNPECVERALPVEKCVNALEEVLDALCGNGQWRSRNTGSRS